MKRNIERKEFFKEFNSRPNSHRMVDSFRNRYGEEFVIYSIAFGDSIHYCVTGDEMNWEFGWRLSGKRLLTQNFVLSEDEYCSVLKIIKKDEL